MPSQKEFPLRSTKPAPKPSLDRQTASIFKQKNFNVLGYHIAHLFLEQN